MLLNSMISSAGPSVTGLLYATSIWLTSMMVILYHRAGIQLIGTIIAIFGLTALLFDVHFVMALSLFAIGLAVHSCGRILLYLKRKP